MSALHRNENILNGKPNYMFILLSNIFINLFIYVFYHIKYFWKNVHQDNLVYISNERVLSVSFSFSQPLSVSVLYISLFIFPLCLHLPLFETVLVNP